MENIYCAIKVDWTWGKKWDRYSGWIDLIAYLGGLLCAFGKIHCVKWDNTVLQELLKMELGNAMS